MAILGEELFRPESVPELVTRHDFWRAAYATMLAELPEADIEEFFASVPMHLGGSILEGLDLIEHLWKEKSYITLDWNYDAVNALEPFLVRKGYNALVFMRKLLHRNNSGTYMPGRVVLSWFYPVMDKVFDKYDPREMVFQLIAVYTETYLPGHFHRRIKKEIDGEWIRSYLCYFSDTTFARIRGLNFDHIAGPQIQFFPRMLNLPEFEDISYLADCRRIEDVVWEGEVTRKDGLLKLNGKLLARCSSFRRFAESHAFDFRKLEPPDLEVYVAEADYFCPTRKRVVVYQGCAYGAPGYISLIRHRKIPNRERKLLGAMIKDAAFEEDLFGPGLAARHASLCVRLRRTLEFTYFPDDESISVNGVHLTRGVPAKILRNIIAARVRQGKKVFAYREFKRDFEISAGQKNANFEVRFYRLMKKVQDAAPSISIVKSGRGMFTLESSSVLKIREE